MEKPAAAMTPKVPSNTTGTAIVGMSVARRFCRKRYITRNTSTMPSNSVFTTSAIEVAHEGRRVVRIHDLQPVRKILRQLIDARADCVRRGERVCAGGELMPMPLAGWPLY